MSSVMMFSFPLSVITVHVMFARESHGTAVKPTVTLRQPVPAS